MGVLVNELSKEDEIKDYIINRLRKIERLLSEYREVESFTKKENEILLQMANVNNELFKKLVDFQENYPDALGRAFTFSEKLTSVSPRQAKLEVLMTFIFMTLYQIQRESSYSLFEDPNHVMTTQKLASINKELLNEWI